MQKKVLIVVESPTFDLNNRYSAVSCVISSFANLLFEDGFEVFINDIALNNAVNLKAVERSEVPTYYRFVSKRIREIVKDILLFRKIQNLKSRIKKNPRPDIIFSWVSYGSSFSADLKRIWNVPLISIFDNPLNEEYAHLFGFKPFFSRIIDYHQGRILNCSDSIIVYSEAVKDYIISKHNVKAHFYFKAFTDFKRMTFKNYDRNNQLVNFGYIGSFFNWHKIDDLIFSFEQLRERGYEAKLTLIGDGVEFQRIKSKITSLKYVNDVRLTGRLDAEELENELEKISVGIISNSLWFQAPVKLFQYSAAQLPVLYRATPTIIELSGNNPGFLPFSNKDELIDRMVFCIESKNSLMELGKFAQEKAKMDFSKESYLSFFRAIFHDHNLT